MNIIDHRATDMHDFKVNEAPLELQAPTEEEINAAAAGVCRFKYERDKLQRTRRPQEAKP